MSFNLTGWPDCGITCAASLLSQSTCSPTNASCYCTDTHFTAVLTTCVTANCTVKEALTLERLSVDSCHTPVEYQSIGLIWLWLAAYIILTAMFALRMVSRMMRLAKWGIDDTTCALAWAFTSVFYSAVVIEAFVLHATIPYYLQDFSSITHGLIVYFVSELIYTIALGLIKASIIFLYIRLFPERHIQRLLWLTQAFIAVQVLAFILLDFGQCRPLSYFWNYWDGEHEGVCLNLNAVAWAHGAVQIVLDVWMLWLPASQIWHLNMTWSRKCGVMAMFLVGIFLTVVTCVRLAQLVQSAINPADMYTYWLGGLWSAIELATGMVVACVPAARVVAIKYAASLKSTFSRSGGNSTNKNTTGGQGGGATASARSHKRSVDATPGSRWAKLWLPSVVSRGTKRHNTTNNHTNNNRATDNHTNMTNNSQFRYGDPDSKSGLGFTHSSSSSDEGIATTWATATHATNNNNNSNNGNGNETLMSRIGGRFRFLLPMPKLEGPNMMTSIGQELGERGQRAPSRLQQQRNQSDISSAAGAQSQSQGQGQGQGLGPPRDGAVRFATTRTKSTRSAFPEHRRSSTSSITDHQQVGRNHSLEKEEEHQEARDGDFSDRNQHLRSASQVELIHTTSHQGHDHGHGHGQEQVDATSSDHDGDGRSSAGEVVDADMTPAAGSGSGTRKIWVRRDVNVRIEDGGDYISKAV